MSNTTNHLSLYEREQIEYYLKLRLSKRSVAKRLKRDSSVIIREINRNRGRDGVYRAKEAQKKAGVKARKTNKRKLDKDEFLLKYVVDQLEEGLSPEQIAGRLKECPPRDLKGQTISHESIYQYIYETIYGKHLYQYLRKARKKRGQKKGRKTQENRIKGRVSIHERPKEIDQKSRYGDWESDLMEFSKQKRALSVQYERKGMLVRLGKVANKTALEKEEALMKSADSLPGYLWKSITFDNGSENACHTKLKDNLGLETYFCDAYSAWQKGGVENINGLIRQYLPRRTDLSKITDEDVQAIQERLNNRPRKSLNYRTPNEIISLEFNIQSGALNS